jgi:asparagine synthase (glutamine-hydrolysing)
MTVAGCDVALVYNGELYNYRELRRELESCGERFVTDGDTEVVLRWIAKDWTQALRKFDGMFALAAWDRRGQKLLLARDAIGEKPLFFAKPAPNLLVFGSEIRSVLVHPEVDSRLDTDALRQALRFRSVYGEASLHRGIAQIKPGGWLEFGRAGISKGTFYDLVAEVGETRQALAGLGEGDLVRAGQDLFRQSVRERLIADVPVGAFLSGGLDSSLIAATVRDVRAPGEGLATFSVGFEGDVHSELPFAQDVASRLGAQHTEVKVGANAFERRLAELSVCRGGPVSEPADVAVAEMSRVARESVKVVLSGEGADEVFCGYPKYAFANAPPIFCDALRILGPDRTARLAGAVGLDGTRALVAARALGQKREIDRLVQWFSYFGRADLQSLFPDLGWTEPDWDRTVTAQQQVLSREEGDGALGRMQIVDCLTWLPGNMLERGDRMTMAEGLEMRPPFLDKELVAFGLALPPQLKLRRGQGKWIVRRWAADLVPAAVIQRKKWGFRVPLAQWFRAELRPMLHDYLTAKRGLCGSFGDVKNVSRLLSQHLGGQADLSTSLWTLLSAEVWYQDVYLSHASNRPAVAPALASVPRGDANLAESGPI